MEAQDSLDEGEVEKEVVYLTKNFRKFLKFKRDGKYFEKGKFLNFKKDKKYFKKKDSKDSSPSQMVTCFKCKGHGHVKKECPTYLKAKDKVFVTTLSDLDSLNSDSEESCDGKGNYSAFMTITPVDSFEDLNALVEELGEHIEVESMEVGEESDDKGEVSMKEQRDYKKLIILFLKRLESMQEWLR